MTPLLWIGFLACFMPFVPHAFAMYARWSTPEGYDNREPRVQAERLGGYGRRAVFAHYNTFESLPPFLFAVLVAAHTGADGTLATALAAGWIACRLAYVAAYLADVHPLRTLAWGAAHGCTIALVLQAAAGATG